MATKIVTKNSSTAGAAPTATDLVQGELAVNVADGRLYTEDNAAAIVELGVNPATEITANAGIALPDSQKATFGAGDDLQIYHDGSNSYISDVGVGNLNLQGNHLILEDPNGVNFLGGNGSTGAVTLYNSGNAKLATTSTGINVTGTATMDGLTVSSTLPIISLTDTTTGADHKIDANSGFASLLFEGDLNSDNASGGMFFKTQGKSRLGVNNGTGDISFYEDTGTTAKLFWDSSAESLGIGTSAPSTGLEVATTNYTFSGTTYDIYGLFGDTSGGIRLGADSSNDDSVIGTTGTNDLQFVTYNGSSWGSRMTLSNTGNVGIGTSTMNGGLNLGNFRGTASAPSFSGTGGDGFVFDYYNDGNPYGRHGSIAVIGAGTATADMSFWTDSGSAVAKRMTIDASGNLLVGTTSLAVASQTGTTQGIRLAGGADNIQVASNGVTAFFNKLGSDGSIIQFNRSGTPVGSIGSAVGNIYVSGTARGWTFGGSNIYPADNNGTKQDNNTDLGHPSFRFDDIYATNGTIQTSDRNEKQDIAELSDAEQRVAVACKGLLRKFRWKDSVAEKGDEARTHFGIIAQDLQAAFAAEGLDAGDYAMFISTTWTDEETNEEKTRMGVRYSELLAFIIAAI